MLTRIALATLCSLLAASCKEGEGSRCQVDSDCRGDLVCNRATSTCQVIGTPDSDASFTPDAAIYEDAPLPDAASDAPTDAPADAPR